MMGSLYSEDNSLFRVDRRLDQPLVVVDHAQENIHPYSDKEDGIGSNLGTELALAKLHTFTHDSSANAEEELVRQDVRIPQASSFVTSTPIARSMTTNAEDCLLTYATTRFWPAYDAGTPDPPHVRVWLDAMEHNTGLYHAMLWQAGLHRCMVEGNNSFIGVALHHNRRAIRHLMNTLPHQEDEVSDTLIFCMVALASNSDSAFEAAPVCEDTFCPPFSGLWWLNVYSRLPFNAGHLEILCRVVKARGGLNKIAIPRLSGLIQYMDVIAASMQLSKPHLPLLDSWQFMRALETRESAFGHGDIGALDQRSLRPEWLLNLGVQKAIIEVFLDLKVYVSLLANYAAGKISNSNLARLGFHRTAIHRQLMMTTASVAAKCSALHKKAVRLTKLITSALQVFALGVTFPLVYRNPIEEAILQMKSIISEINAADCLQDTNHEALYLWSCMLGAVGGRSSVRLWFEEKLIHMEVARMISVPGGAFRKTRAWTDIKAILTEILWMDIACDSTAERVWGRVETAVEMYFAILPHIQSKH